MSIYLGVIEYSATGEGVTRYIIMKLATDEFHFVDLIKKDGKIDPYYLIGLDVYDIDTYQTAYIPEYFKNLFKDFSTNPPMIELFFELHYNYS